MKKLTLVVTVFALVALMSFSAQAQGKMAANIGADILIPMGDFADAAKIGFGGTAMFEYMVNPNLAVTGKLGYITWGAKTGDNSAVEASFSGLPFLVGGKYYFMPQGKLRAYGQFELGLFFLSASVKSNVPGFSYSASASSTDFVIAPAFGVEIPAGPKGAVDASVRYWGIFKEGSAHNIGFRVGYKILF